MQTLRQRAVARLSKMGLGSSILALLFAALFTLAAVLLIGKDPLAVTPAILEGAFGSKNGFAEVLVKTSPLLLAGLGTAFAFRCQMWNIGVEGQLLMGALAASVVSLSMPNAPGFFIVAIALIASFLSGGFWAGIAGFLKAKIGASEIITTIMLNYVAIYLVNFLVRGPLKDESGYVPQSPPIPQQAWLLRILPPSRLHVGIVIAVLAAILVYYILWRTPFGFSVIAVGSNPRAARAGGISVSRSMVMAMFISGGLAGLAGAGEVMGLHHRMLDGISAGYGFSAIAVAILGGLHPAGIAIWSFLLAALRVGADHMQRQLGVPAALVLLLEGSVILFLQGRKTLSRMWTSKRLAEAAWKRLKGEEKHVGNDT